MKNVTSSLNLLTDKERGWGRILVPMLITIGTLLGFQIIWPKEKMAGLEAQQHLTEVRVDSVERKLEAYKTNNALSLYEINRRLNVLSILSCASVNRTSTAFRLAGCDAFLKAGQ